MATAVKLKRMGVRRGVPDLLLPARHGKYSGLAIEMKHGKNKPTKEQRDWMEHFKSEGYYTAVCYNAEEAIRAINDFLYE